MKRTNKQPEGKTAQAETPDTMPDTEAVAESETLTETLVPVETVTDTGEVKETALVAAPIVFDSEKFSRIEQSLQQLASMKSGISMNAKYREFTREGESVRGVFIGFRTIIKSENSEPKAIRAAAWIDESKTVFINAGVTLCKQFDEIPEGTPVEITYAQSLKVEMGKCKVYDVKPLFF